jgi:hypothetical protein
MTRTDVMASSRPRTAGTAARGRSARSRRGLLLLPVLLVAFALMLPGTALAAGESTSGYSSKPKEPTTGTSPSKETGTTPTKSEEPAKTATTPATEKATTLPFTGFDLRWSLAVGLVLIGAGFSIVVVQRRHHRGRSR